MNVISMGCSSFLPLSHVKLSNAYVPNPPHSWKFWHEVMEPKVWSCKSRYSEPDWEPENWPTLQFTQNMFKNLLSDKPPTLVASCNSLTFTIKALIIWFQNIHSQLKFISYPVLGYNFWVFKFLVWIQLFPKVTFFFLLVRCTKADSQVHILTLSSVSIGLKTQRHGEE